MSGEAGWGEPTGNGGGRSPSPSGNRRSQSPQRRPDDVDRNDRGRPSTTGDASNPGNNLHVSGLSTKIEDKELEDMFAPFGRVQRVQVMRDPHTRDPRGFAFVTMETPEEADKAIQGLNATEQYGKVISIERARRGRARTPTPGAYHGPPKKDFTRDPRGGGRYDDRDQYYDRRDYDRGGRRDYDSRGGYDRRDYDRRDDRYSYAAPMRDDRGGSDRRSYYDDRRGAYDDRRGGGGGGRYDDYDRRRY